jgi:A/G-specific adenine glycosylase
VPRHCAAREAGIVEQVPARRKAKPTPLFHRHVFCIRRGGRWLIEQRPARGRWAGLWQFVTLEAQDAQAVPDSASLPAAVGGVVRLGAVTHALTHRRYEFTVHRCEALVDAIRERRGRGAATVQNRRWVTLAGLARFPLPRPHVKVAEMLREQAG